MMRYVIPLLLGLLLLGWLLTGVTQIQPGELAVVRRFGRVLADQPGPGLHVGLPWGIDRVDRVPMTRERSLKVGYNPDAEESDWTTPPGQLLTGDQNLVNAQVILDYSVGERDGDVVDYVLNAERVDALLTRICEAALAEWVASRPVEDVLLNGKRLLPDWFMTQAQERLARYHLGVRIKAASVPHLFPPAAVKPAFEEVARAQATIDTRVNQARQQSKTRWNEALATKVQIENQTKSNVVAQKLKAEAEARNFEARLEPYQRLGKDNPKYLNAMWWEEMSKVYAQMRADGRIDLLDNRIGADGLDITQFPLMPRKK